VAADAIVDAVASLAGYVDIFVLYAVLEHMTVAERLEILEVARATVRPTGAIVVCELPNRLIAQDHHTSQLPFFSQLPDELSLEYFERSTREDFVAGMRRAVAAGADAARQALVHWGRGASYHEFEIALGDLRHRVVASNYDELLMPVREIHREELALAQLLSQQRPDLAPAWSRYWQDVILRAAPVEQPPKFITPWTMETGHSPGVAWTREGSIEILAGGELRVQLPVPTERLLVGIRVADGDVAVEVEGEHDTIALPLPIWRHPASPRYTTVDLPAGTAEVRLRLTCAGNLVFLGYEA
jgi:hypothetical protein